MVKDIKDLPWKPHAVIPGMQHARYGGFSVIHDPRGWLHTQLGWKDHEEAVYLYEVMSPDGEIHGGLTPRRVLEMINAQR